MTTPLMPIAEGAARDAGTDAGYPGAHTYHPTGHNQAAPRTPLESPWRWRRSAVASARASRRS